MKWANERLTKPHNDSIGAKQLRAAAALGTRWQQQAAGSSQ